MQHTAGTFIELQKYRSAQAGPHCPPTMLPPRKGPVFQRPPASSGRSEQAACAPLDRTRAVFKGILCDLGIVRQNGNVLQRVTFPKRMLSDFFHSRRDHDPFERPAMRKCVLPDLVQLLRQLNFLQRLTVVKRCSFDLSHLRGNRDLLQRTAIFKCVILQFLQPVRQRRFQQG